MFILYFIIMCSKFSPFASINVQYLVNTVTELKNKQTKKLS